MDLSLLIEYIEGKWTATEFQWILEEDEMLCARIRNIYAEAIGRDDYNIIPNIMSLNLSKKADVEILDAIIERILKQCGLTYNKAKKKERPESELELADIILPYLDDDSLAEKYINENILTKISAGLTKTQQKKYCKDRQKELFRYKSHPPKWIQSGEWQYDSTGQPLIFSHSYKKDKEGEAFVFVNADGDETVEIIQYY